MMEDLFEQFLKELKKMRDDQKALVEATGRVWSDQQVRPSYSVKDVERADLSVLERVLRVAERIRYGDMSDEDSIGRIP
jgi:hypothetical protein